MRQTGPSDRNSHRFGQGSYGGNRRPDRFHHSRNARGESSLEPRVVKIIQRGDCVPDESQAVEALTNVSSDEDAYMEQHLARATNSRDTLYHRTQSVEHISESIQMMQINRFSQPKIEHCLNGLLGVLGERGRLHDLKNGITSLMIQLAVGNQTFRRIFWNWALTKMNLGKEEDNLLLVQIIGKVFASDAEMPSLSQYSMVVFQHLFLELDRTSHPGMVASIVGALKTMSSSYNNAFVHRFQDTVDILLGWWINDACDETIREEILRFMRSVQPYWTSSPSFYEQMTKIALTQIDAAAKEVNECSSETELKVFSEKLIAAQRRMFMLASLIEINAPIYHPPLDVTRVSYLHLLVTKFLKGMEVLFEKEFHLETFIAVLLCLRVMVEVARTLISPCLDLMLLFLVETLARHHVDIRGLSLAHHLLVLLDRMVVHVGTSIPPSVVKKMLDPSLGLVHLRLSLDRETFHNTFRLFQRMIGIKYAPLVHELYRFVVDDCHRAKMVLMGSKSAGDMDSDLQYTVDEAATILTFNTCCLANLATYKSSVLAHLDLQPSPLQLLIEHLIIPHNHFLHTELEASVLGCLYVFSERGKFFPAKLITEESRADPARLRMTIEYLAKVAARTSRRETRKSCLNHLRSIPTACSSKVVLDSIQTTDWDQVLTNLTELVLSEDGEPYLTAVEILKALVGLPVVLPGSVLRVYTCLYKENRHHDIRDAILDKVQLHHMLSFNTEEVSTAASNESHYDLIGKVLARRPNTAVSPHCFRKIIEFVVLGRTCRKPDLVKEVRCLLKPVYENSGDFYKLIADGSCLEWILSYEAAHYVVSKKLRTSIGTPKTLFVLLSELLATALKDPSCVDVPASPLIATVPIQFQPSLVLTFAENVEKLIALALDGVAGGVTPSTGHRTFFLLNESTILGWFKQARPLLLGLSVVSNKDSSVLYHGSAWITENSPLKSQNALLFEVSIGLMTKVLSETGDWMSLSGILSSANGVLLDNTWPGQAVCRIHTAQRRYEESVQDFRLLYDAWTSEDPKFSWRRTSPTPAVQLANCLLLEEVVGSYLQVSSPEDLQLLYSQINQLDPRLFPGQSAAFTGSGPVSAALDYHVSLLRDWDQLGSKTSTVPFSRLPNFKDVVVGKLARYVDGEDCKQSFKVPSADSLKLSRWNILRQYDSHLPIGLLALEKVVRQKATYALGATGDMMLDLALRDGQSRLCISQSLLTESIFELTSVSHHGFTENEVGALLTSTAARILMTTNNLGLCAKLWPTLDLPCVSGDTSIAAGSKLYGGPPARVPLFELPMHHQKSLLMTNEAATTSCRVSDTVLQLPTSSSPCLLTSGPERTTIDHISLLGSPCSPCLHGDQASRWKTIGRFYMRAGKQLLHHLGLENIKQGSPRPHLVDIAIAESYLGLETQPGDGIMAANLEDDLPELFRNEESHLARLHALLKHSALAYLEFIRLSAQGAGAQSPDPSLLHAQLSIISTLKCLPSNLREEVTASFSRTPPLSWKGALDQMIAVIADPSQDLRTAFCSVVSSIAHVQPHVVLYPVLEHCMEEESRGGVSALQPVLDHMRLRVPQMVTHTWHFIEELRRIAVLSDEFWSVALNQTKPEIERRRNQFEEEALAMQKVVGISPAVKESMLKEKYFAIMNPLLLPLLSFVKRFEQPPRSSYEGVFCSTVLPAIQWALSQCQNPPDIFHAAVGWDSLVKLADEVQIFSHGSHDRLKLEDLSSFLGSQDFSALNIVLPFQTSQSDFIRLSSFSKEVWCLPTKSRPKQIGVLSETGTRHHMLLKGLEDLHLDSRVMQFLSCCDAVLCRADCSSGRKDMNRITTYTVVPLGHKAGMIQWVEDAVPLMSLYKNWLQRQTVPRRETKVAQLEERRPSFPGTSARRGLLLLNRQKNAGVTTLETPQVTEELAKEKDPVRFSRPLEMFIAKVSEFIQDREVLNGPRKNWPSDILAKVHAELVQVTPKNLISRELWCCSIDTADWWRITTAYSHSLSTTSLMGYVIGLGDRHLENVLLDSKSGRIVHIDYNVVFDRGSNLKIPERVPCRLTQNLVQALGLPGINGIFRHNAEHVNQVLRDNSDVLLELLISDIGDPRLDWNPSHDILYHPVWKSDIFHRRQLDRVRLWKLFGCKMAEIALSWKQTWAAVRDTVKQLQSDVQSMMILPESPVLERDLEMCRQQSRSLIEARGSLPAKNDLVLSRLADLYFAEEGFKESQANMNAFLSELNHSLQVMPYPVEETGAETALESITGTSRETASCSTPVSQPTSDENKMSVSSPMVFLDQWKAALWSSRQVADRYHSVCSSLPAWYARNDLRTVSSALLLARELTAERAGEVLLLLKRHSEVQQSMQVEGKHIQKVHQQVLLNVDELRERVAKLRLSLASSSGDNPTSGLRPEPAELLPPDLLCSQAGQKNYRPITLLTAAKALWAVLRKVQPQEVQLKAKKKRSQLQPLLRTKEEFLDHLERIEAALDIAISIKNVPTAAVETAPAFQLSSLLSLRGVLETFYTNALQDVLPVFLLSVRLFPAEADELLRFLCDRCPLKVAESNFNWSLCPVNFIQKMLSEVNTLPVNPAETVKQLGELVPGLEYPTALKAPVTKLLSVLAGLSDTMAVVVENATVSSGPQAPLAIWRGLFSWKSAVFFNSLCSSIIISTVPHVISCPEQGFFFQKKIAYAFVKEDAVSKLLDDFMVDLAPVLLAPISVTVETVVHDIIMEVSDNTAEPLLKSCSMDTVITKVLESVTLTLASPSEEVSNLSALLDTYLQERRMLAKRRQQLRHLSWLETSLTCAESAAASFEWIYRDFLCSGHGQDNWRRLLSQAEEVQLEVRNILNSPDVTAGSGSLAQFSGAEQILDQLRGVDRQLSTILTSEHVRGTSKACMEYADCLRSSLESWLSIVTKCEEIQELQASTRNLYLLIKVCRPPEDPKLWIDRALAFYADNLERLHIRLGELESQKKTHMVSFRDSVGKLRRFLSSQSQLVDEIKPYLKEMANDPDHPLYQGSRQFVGEMNVCTDSFRALLSESVHILSTDLEAQDRRLPVTKLRAFETACAGSLACLHEANLKLSNLTARPCIGWETAWSKSTMDWGSTSQSAAQTHHSLAMKAIKLVKERLGVSSSASASSVKAQVEHMISEAMSVDNLSQMYEGWMSWV